MTTPGPHGPTEPAPQPDHGQQAPPYGQPQYGQQAYGQPQYGQQPAGAPGWNAGPPAPPQEVHTSFWLWIASTVLGVIGAIVAFTNVGAITDQIAQAAGAGRGDAEIAATAVTVGIVIGAVFGLLVVVAQVIFAVFMRRGRNWARIVLTIFGALGVVSALVGLLGASSTTINGQVIETGSTLSTILSVVQAILIVAAIVMFFRPRANQYFAAASGRVG